MRSLGCPANQGPPPPRAHSARGPPRRSAWPTRPFSEPPTKMQHERLPFQGPPRPPEALGGWSCCPVRRCSLAPSEDARTAGARSTPEGGLTHTCPALWGPERLSNPAPQGASPAPQSETGTEGPASDRGRPLESAPRPVDRPVDRPMGGGRGPRSSQDPPVQVHTTPPSLGSAVRVTVGPRARLRPFPGFPSHAPSQLRLGAAVGAAAAGARGPASRGHAGLWAPVPEVVTLCGNRGCLTAPVRSPGGRGPSGICQRVSSGAHTVPPPAASGRQSGRTLSDQKQCKARPNTQSQMQTQQAGKPVAAWDSNWPPRGLQAGATGLSLGHPCLLLGQGAASGGRRLGPPWAHRASPGGPWGTSNSAQGKRAELGGCPRSTYLPLVGRGDEEAVDDGGEAGLQGELRVGRPVVRGPGGTGPQPSGTRPQGRALSPHRSQPRPHAARAHTDTSVRSSLIPVQRASGSPWGWDPESVSPHF